VALFGKPKPPNEVNRNPSPSTPAPVAKPLSASPSKPTSAQVRSTSQTSERKPSMANQTKGANAVIGSSIIIKGELFGDEELVIEGRVEGKINIKNRLVIGQKGSVEADIEAKSVVINGRVNGNVLAQRVEIVASGSLEGNIKAPKISIADGAHFKGSVDMSQCSPESGSKPAAKTPAKSPIKPGSSFKL